MKTMPLLIAIGLTAGCESKKQDASASKPVEGSERAAVTAPLPAPAPAPAAAAPTEDRVTSKDGATIAFERAGKGPAVIVVSGALSHRGLMKDPSLVGGLAEHFTVYTYDRRGRGASTDVKPYAVEREIEDLAALVDAAGGSAYVYGVSSGAALSLQAAASLGAAKITKLALYEPPYGHPAAAFAEQKKGVEERVAKGEPGDAAQFFMTAIGTPADAIDGMKRSVQWAPIAKMDFTLAYDFAILGDGQVPEAVARAVTVPTLVMNGDKSMPFMQPTADALAALMPGAERRTLAGQTHNAQGAVVAPVLVEFFGAK